MFEVPSPSASQSFTFQFTEFEVSEVTRFLKYENVENSLAILGRY